jgi:hypothetical protein
VNTLLSIGENVTSVPLWSNGDWGQYLIVFTPVQDVSFLGVDVEMHVVANLGIPRTRYLRRVTLETYLENKDELYGDLEREPILQSELVDTTLVSGVCEYVL